MHRPVHRPIVWMLTLLAALPVGAQLPDSPTGRAGNAILGVVRGGPEAVTVDFFETWFSTELLAAIDGGERAEQLARNLERFGGLEIQGVERNPGMGATIMGSAENGAQIEIRYEVDDEAPHRITAFAIEATGEAMAPLEADELAGALEAYLDGLAADDELSGVVLVARGNDVVFEGAWGLANRRFDAPNRIDTPFNLGSINKIFTKIAIAQLARDGKLSLDDTVAEHLPDYPNQDVAERITIAQVAAHTAGLGDIFTDEFVRLAKSELRRPSDYFPLFANDPLLFEPGEGNAYSNGGYMVLGAIIAAVTGTTYDDYVREHVLEPAGMHATVPYSLDDPEARFATGYTTQGDDHGEGPLRENSFMIPFTGTPAGGGYSTARDLLAFRHAFTNQRLLDGPYFAWVLGNELPETAPPVDPNGLGFGIAGGGPGVGAVLEIDGEWTVVVMINVDSTSTMEVSRQLRAMVAAVERNERQAR